MRSGLLGWVDKNDIEDAPPEAAAIFCHSVTLAWGWKAPRAASSKPTRSASVSSERLNCSDNSCVPRSAAMSPT